MKQKITVTIDKEKLKHLDAVLKKGKFRNKSHIIEYSLDKLLKKELKWQKN